MLHRYKETSWIQTCPSFNYSFIRNRATVASNGPETAPIWPQRGEGEIHILNRGQHSCTQKPTNLTPRTKFLPKKKNRNTSAQEHSSKSHFLLQNRVCSCIKKKTTTNHTTTTIYSKGSKST